MTLNWSPVGDFLAVCDGTQAVSVYPRNGNAYAVDTALLESISDREVARSNGKYRSQDVRIHLPVSDVQGLLPGDVIRDKEGVEFTVITATKATLSDRWDCVCRNLLISEGLDTLVTIQVATVAKGSSGAHKQTWSDLHTDVRGKIQRTESTHQAENGSHTLLRKYQLFMREVLDLRNTHRIIGPDDVIYRITGYQEPEDIAGLTTVDLEVWI